MARPRLRIANKAPAQAGATGTVPYRRFVEATSGRRPGAVGRFGSYGSEVAAAFGLVRGRARAAAVNNPWAAKGVAAMVAALVGAGIVPTPQATSPTDRAALVALWGALVPVADLDGATDLYGLQALAARGLVVDGEAFIHMPTDEWGELRLRLVPPEMVAEDYTAELPAGGYIRQGVEFNAAAIRVAYHVREPGPYGVETAAPPIRIPAAEMIHLRRVLGAGQVRGLSWLAPVLLRLGEVDQTEDALLVNAKIQAMLAGFLVDQTPAGVAGALPWTGTQQGDALTSGLEPGTLTRLPPGTDIKFSSPQQAAGAVDFLRVQLRAVAAGLGVPEFMLTGDLTAANYSSLRAGLLDFRATVEQHQHGVLVPQMVAPIWRRAVTLALIRGDLSGDLRELARMEAIPPALPSVDPAKDAAALREMLALGLTSRRQAVAGQGYSVETLDREIADDRAREAAAGLAFAPAVAPQAEPQDPAS